jgi:copper(I)-binding protein
MRPGLCFLLGWLAWTSTAANAVPADDVSICQAWLRPTAPGQKIASAYLHLTAGRDLLLTGGSSPWAARVELHSMNLHDGVMHMRQLPSVGLPRGQPVKFQPGGMHLMLTGLKAPIRPDERVPVTLHFEDRQGRRWNLDLDFVVRETDE